MVTGAFFTLDFLLAFHLPWTITCCHQTARITNGAGIAYLYRAKVRLICNLNVFVLAVLAVLPLNCRVTQNTHTQTHKASHRCL